MIQSQLSLLIFQGGGGSGLGLALWPLLLMFAVFYLFLILPQQKRQKRWQEMVNGLKAGDRVSTAGGIRGIIISVKDDAVHLRVPPDNLRLEVSKSAISSVVRDDEPEDKKEKK